MRQDSLISGTVALTIAALFNRVVGFMFRAYLVRVVGQEAIGLYQMAYPLYASIMTVATAGISVGVAKLTADARRRGNDFDVNTSLKTGCYLALFTGVGGMLILMLGSSFIANELLGEERAFLPLMALAPALPIVSLAGAFRGYYQGMRYMYLVATGLIAEQIAHVFATIQIALRLKGLGVGAISTGLALGCTAGELVGLITLAFLAIIVARNRTSRANVNFRPLLGMVLPVAAGRIILAVSSALNTVLIPRSLRFMGYSASDAAIAYGQLTGMAINVLFIPAVLTFPFASNLLPMMAESVHAAQSTLKKRNFHRALAFSLILGIPCSVLFVSAGPQICDLLFGVPEAGRLLSLMGWVAWMIYVQHITTATLQGLGKPAIPARNAAISTLLSSVIVLVLSRMWPSLRIDAAVYAIMTGVATGAILGLIEVLRQIGGLNRVAHTIAKGAFAGSISLFTTENILALLGTTQSFYHTLITLVVVIVSFVSAAMLVGLHKEHLRS